MPEKETTKKDYLERINRVLVYIQDHLNEKLELEDLARISNFSPYHFHRILHAYLREPIGSYIKRIRLDKSAQLLNISDLSINEIAWEVGYESPASFTRAFKKRFNVSPTEFRNNALKYRLNLEIVQPNIENIKTDLKPKFKKLKPRKVIYIQSIGPYDGSGTENAWNKLVEFAKKYKLFGLKTDFYGISYDDPKVTESGNLRYEAVMTVRKFVKPDGEVGLKELAGGNYAVFRYTGPYTGFQNIYDEIYRYCLNKTNGIKLRNSPCMEKYLNTPQKTKPENLKTDIYIPID